MSSLYYHVSKRALDQLKQIQDGYYARYHREYRKHHIQVKDPSLITWYCCKCKLIFPNGNRAQSHHRVLH